MVRFLICSGPYAVAEKKEEKVVLLDAPSGKPRVLVLGGCGFIGRNFVKYLVDNKLASHIKVADKAIPGTSYLSADHKAAFEQKNIVEFKQSDLAKEGHCPVTSHIRLTHINQRTQACVCAFVALFSIIPLCRDVAVVCPCAEY